ncbi:GNAT family N-acetyltransferase [Nonomuraea sp. NEAU-A123]|uniref:GNAT family N-acetyltransferase n=1 Tax=Nonomuraea sp. NEAU-A123 TaxID=2839649 RepID=UPI001BE4292E|nr:GNAT family N-acetyltransferase [Nonomuraea sp. NEAU-A123]MBT2225794.1 GNAT family N-acetyltransferase [Nonomuraea sp. NEAU-A123]
MSELAAEVRLVPMSDPAAEPLLAGLHLEYTSRYGSNDELARYPEAEFAPPHGAFLIVVCGGETVAGGAFRRYDAATAELKRVWTHPRRRGTGLGRLVVRELEREAVRRGYRRIHLTTGPRQPEAVRLYLASGYEPQFDVADPPTAGPLAFARTLTARHERN